MLLHSIGLALLSCALIHATPINKVEETSGDMGIEASGSEIENSGMETSGGEGSGVDIIIAFNKEESSGIEKEQFSGEESGTSGFDEVIWTPADCPRLMYGNYRLSACSNRFLSCSNGLSYFMDCPAGLLYNAARDQCDWPHNIIGCEDASGEELKDISGSGIEASGDFSGLTSELGIESSGAVQEIIVDASGNVISIIDASGDLEESGSGSGLGSGEEMSFEVLVFTLVDCRLLSDGFYPLTACEAKYVSCRAGLPSVLHCFPGQFYSAIHQICEEPHKIGCTDDGDFSGSGDLIFSGEFSGFSGEFSGFSGEFSGFSGEESGFGSGEFSGELSGMSGDVLFFSTLDCSSLSNGNYPMGACSAQFLSCSNNLPFIMDCPSNLFYNWAIDACDWPANLGCDFEASGLDGSGSGDEQPSCTENNGSFPVGPCLPVFVKCVDGSRFEMSCESGQLFSEKDSICLPAAQLNCTAST